jgi:DNA-binding response OmpR family regulator
MRRIIIIDYEPNLVSICRMVIDDGVFEVNAFTNSFLALSNFNHNFYDLLILDIKMPDMDSIDLYKKIRVR